MIDVKISRNSWHFRLMEHYSSAYRYEPKDLCSYFWGLMFRLLWTVGGVLLVAVAVHLVAAAALSPLITYGVQSYLGFPIVQTWFSYCCFVPVSYTPIIWDNHILSYILYAITAIAGFCFWITETDYGYNWMDKLMSKAGESLNFTGVVGAYIRARKEKYCPIIELVD